MPPYVETPVPSQPDIAKLQSMTDRVASVHRIIAKNAAEQCIHNQVKMTTVDQIRQLQDAVGKEHGPGTYRFTVADNVGPEKVMWVVKLGASDGASDTAGASMAFEPTTTGRVISGNSGSSSTVRQIGRGITWDSETSLLSTPYGVFTWTPGEPLPAELRAASQTGQPVGQATFTPWSSQQPFGPAPPSYSAPGWGGEDPRMKVLEQQLAESRETQREAARRTEIEALRQEAEKDRAERRAEMEKDREERRRMTEESNRRLELLIAKMSEPKPASGPSPEMLEVQRRLELAERKSLEEAAARREETARLEAKHATERLEARLAEQAMRFEAQLRDATANKSDPMLPVLVEMIRGNSTSSERIAQTMKDSILATAEASKENAAAIADRLAGSVMTPTQAVDLVRMAKDQSANSAINDAQISMFKTTFGMAQDLLQRQSEMMSESNGPPWLGIAQQVVERGGQVAQAYAAQKAAENARAEATEKRRAEAEEIQRRRVAVRQAAQAAQATQAAPASAPAQPQSRPLAPSAIERERIAADLPLFQKSTSSVERDAIAAQVFRQPAPAQPEPSVEPQVRRRVRRQETAPPPPQEAPPVDLRDISPEDIRAFATQNFPDDESFFSEHVASTLPGLRHGVATGAFTVEQIAEGVLDTRQKLRQQGIVPSAMELLTAGHIEIVIERLLPDAPLEFQKAIVDAIRARLRAVEE